MTGSLRDRIAAVVYAHDCWDYAGGLECRCGSRFSFGDDDPHGDAITPWSNHVADALLAEVFELRGCDECGKPHPKCECLR